MDETADCTMLRLCQNTTMKYMTIDSVKNTMLIACLLGVQHHMLEKPPQNWVHSGTLHHALVLIKLSRSSIMFELVWNCLWREVIVSQLLSADKCH